MVESKIKCDVCGSDVEHITKLHMLSPSEHKEWTIPCLCEDCREAIESALDTRQHIVGCTVTPIEPKRNGVYNIVDGKVVPKSSKR